MIARLKGLVEAIGDTWVIIDVHGVGYLASCSQKTLRNLPPIGEATSLHIETLMKAESLTLYGFGTGDEQNCFRILLTVQGVGPRMGISLLSALSPEEIQQAIYDQEYSPLTQADGVGPKLAQRIIRELKDKIFDKPLEITNDASVSSAPVSRVKEEAISALLNLGYRRLEAVEVVTNILKTNTTASLNHIISTALKSLASKVSG
jgi:Holliday junction DNA helicase RuvA